jgi:hypothetical protein
MMTKDFGATSTGLSLRKGHTAEMPDPGITGGLSNPGSLPEPTPKTCHTPTCDSAFIKWRHWWTYEDLESVKIMKNNRIQKQKGGGAAPFLDPLKHNCNRRGRPTCGAWTIAGELEGQTRFYRLGCKAWDCPICGPKRAFRLRFGVAEAATTHNLVRLMTLTLDPRKCSAAKSPHYIKQAWRKMRVYLARKHNCTIQFIAILEFQKNGYAHLHVLVDRYLDQRWLKSAWQRVGGGSIVDIRMVEMQHVAAYLSKYMTKEMLLSKKYGKIRRYSTSRGIKLFPKKEDGVWWLIKQNIEAQLRLRNKEATDIKIDRNNLLTSFSVPEIGVKQDRPKEK